MSDGADMQETDLAIVYDGHCPFCASYVRLYRIREGGRRVHLIDGRTPHPILDEINERNLDLDAGMVVKFGNRLYHGAARDEHLGNSGQRPVIVQPRQPRALRAAAIGGMAVSGTRSRPAGYSPSSRAQADR